MAGQAITFDATDVSNALSRVLRAATDLAPILKNIGESQQKATQRRFIDETDPDGQKWQALNPLYKQTKRGPRILTGANGNRGGLAAIVYQLASDTSVQIGSPLPYARIHNQGGKIVPKSAAALIFSMGGKTIRAKSVTIPKRQFLGINADDAERIREVIIDHLQQELDGATGE